MKPRPKHLDTVKKRHRRIRKKISGIPDRPRLCVFRSHNHFEAQLIDDLNHRTLVSASTRDKKFKAEVKLTSSRNTKASKALGSYLAGVAMEKGIKRVVFDRAGYLYHGRVKEFANAARETGLEF